MRKLVCLSALLAIAGCSTASRDITAAHVSPTQYQSYECEQLLFLPTLFAIGGTKEEEAEYGRLKGEHAALQQASIRKGCPASQPGSVAFRG